MSRHAIHTLLVVSALLLLSCEKEVAPAREDGRVSFTLPAPGEDRAETRVSGNGTALVNNKTQYKFKWDAGDALTIFSHDPSVNGSTPVYAATPWGTFTTADGGSTATFTGTAPSSYSTTSLLAIYSPSSQNLSLTWNAGSKRYDALFNIPSEQDGTGVRYSLFAGKPSYNPSSHTIVAGSGSANVMALRSTLTCFTLKPEDNICRVTITVSDAKDRNSQYLCSTGTNKDITLNCTGLFLSAGTNRTITLYNGGQRLSGEVWFASRQTTGNATNGYAILTFVFENAAGVKASKIVRLAVNPHADGSADTYRNLTAGQVNRLGTVNFGDGELSYDGDFSPLAIDDEEDTQTDRIPDFSRVGYKYGDAPIPSPAVAETIDLAAVSAALASGTAADTTDFFQQAIDRVGAAGGGAILIKNGTYNVSRILFLDSDNVVLRGESEAGTLIKYNASIQAPIVYMGRSVPKASTDTESESLTFIAGRRVGISRLKAMGNGGASSYGSVYIVTYSPKIPGRTYGSNARISEDYVPLGRLYVEVHNAKPFKPGDPVVIYRKPNQAWLDDIGMTRIASNGREAVGSPTNQWDISGYTMSWSRKVTSVRGNRVYLDAPVAQSLETRYGYGELRKYAMDRVSGCGVENLSFDCRYDKTNLYNGNEVDESHAWQAVQVKAAEHCWVRNVTSRHMGYALADMGDGARCITVEKCTSLSPVSAIQGARRYAFCCSPGSELCLVKDCYCEYDRHSFVTNGTALGPNVFTNCRSEFGYNAIGPHFGWATATLYDCIQADSPFEAQDGGNQGTGHGWRGVNTVFWNVETSWSKYVVCQSVWGTCPSCGQQWNRTEECSSCHAQVVPSARNYAVGVIGQKWAHSVYWDKDYYGNPTSDFFINMYGWGANEYNRPDGAWYPAMGFTERGSSHVTLPASPNVSWWPRLEKTSFSHPQSLYQCQLEDRHERGIYLNML